MIVKISQKIALGLMITAIVPSTHAAQRLILKSAGIAVESKEEAKAIFEHPQARAIVESYKSTAEVDRPTIPELVEEAQKGTNLSGGEIVSNASIVTPLVNSNYDGLATKEDFYLLLEVDQKRIKEEARLARSLQLDLSDGHTPQLLRQMEGNNHLKDKKNDPSVVKISLEQVKAGVALDHTVILPRAQLLKDGCRDDSPEALASLGHIDANDLTNIEFDGTHVNYVGGDKNLNIQTLAALARSGVAHPNDPDLADFEFVRAVVEGINKVNDTKKYPPIAITGNLVDVALHVEGLALGLTDEETFATILGYDYLVNGLRLLRADVDANRVVLATAYKTALKQLKVFGLINYKANNSLNAVDPTIAAAAIQLADTPALAGRANAQEVTIDDINVVAELFHRQPNIRIRNVAGIGFNAATVNAARKIMLEFKKKRADFSGNHVVAAQDHMNNAGINHIANLSWEQIDASAKLRTAGVGHTVNNVNASVYLESLEDAHGLGIDSENAGQIAAVIAMQNVGFAGGTIAKPNEEQVIQYVALQTAGGIALNKLNVNASVYLESLDDANGLGIDSEDADQIAAVIAMQNIAFAGGTIAKPNEAQVIQYDALRVTGGIALDKPNVNASVYLSELANPGALGIDDQDAGQIAAVIAMQTAANLADKIEKPTAREVLEYVRLNGAVIPTTAKNIKVSAYLQDLGKPAVANPAIETIEATIRIMDSADPDVKAEKPTVARILAVQRLLKLDNTGALIDLDNISATVALQDKQGVAPAIAKPKRPQVDLLALISADPDFEDALDLAAWKIQQEVGGAAAYLPGGIAKYLSKAGTVVEFEYMDLTPGGGGFGATAGRIAGSKFKVDAANLAGLPKAPVAGEFLVFNDLADDALNGNLVTLVGGDNK